MLLKATCWHRCQFDKFENIAIPTWIAVFFILTAFDIFKLLISPFLLKHHLCVPVTGQTRFFVRQKWVKPCASPGCRSPTSDFDLPTDTQKSKLEDSKHERNQSAGLLPVL